MGSKQTARPLRRSCNMPMSRAYAAEGSTCRTSLPRTCSGERASEGHHRGGRLAAPNYSSEPMLPSSEATNAVAEIGFAHARTIGQIRAFEDNSAHLKDITALRKLQRCLRVLFH